jgi:hypothetical protein
MRLLGRQLCSIGSTRRDLAAAISLLVLVVGPGATDDGSVRLTGIFVTTETAHYAGDSRLQATISPNGDGYRDQALIGFHLSGTATVEVVVAAVGWRPKKVFDRSFRLRGGSHIVAWKPTQVSPRTYVVRLAVRGRRQDGWHNAVASSGRLPVVRVLGVEATFLRESYAPGRAAGIVLATDEPLLTLRMFRAVEGAETRVAGDVEGAAVSEPVQIHQGHRDRPRRVQVWIGNWPSGLYLARLTTPDGRSTYAPVVVRPRHLGTRRVAVVLPTYTWQAYNFRDANRDGYGDTWYADRTRQTLLARPYMDRGLPPYFRSYDVPFLRWLAHGEEARSHRADFLSDADLGAVRGPADLAAAYDLIVFPGHHEYVTRRELALVRGFRNRGGNLIFLSANNFFYRVDRQGRTLTRVAKWRSIGLSEASLIGVQYAASDRGGQQAPYVIRNASRTPWLFAGTGLASGSRFGRFGVEIDATTRTSPESTIVLAEIPHVIGGRTAQMTYYETRNTARVFAAGAFTLGGRATREPVAQLLENLWDHLARP